MVGHPHPDQDEVLLAVWLLLLASQERLQGLDGQWGLALLEKELKRPGQAMMGKSEVGLGDSESA